MEQLTSTILTPQLWRTSPSPELWSTSGRLRGMMPPRSKFFTLRNRNVKPTLAWREVLGALIAGMRERTSPSLRHARTPPHRRSSISLIASPSVARWSGRSSSLRSTSSPCPRGWAACCSGMSHPTRKMTPPARAVSTRSRSSQCQTPRCTHCLLGDVPLRCGGGLGGRPVTSPAHTTGDFDVLALCASLVCLPCVHAWCFPCVPALCACLVCLPDVPAWCACLPAYREIQGARAGPPTSRLQDWPPPPRTQPTAAESAPNC